MRIDFQSNPQALPEANRASSQSAQAASSSVTPTQAAADQAQWSGAHVQVEALAAQAGQLPEIREQRVQSLRAAVAGGSYRADAREVAGAMLAEMISAPAA